ncbi:MAG: hypothetical protein AAGD88_17905, partial [Bacteroidota bacterium]
VQKANGIFHVKGTLKMLDTNLEYIIPLEYKNGVFKVQFSLNRKNHDLGKRFPTMIIGNNINITIHCVTNTK